MSWRAAHLRILWAVLLAGCATPRASVRPPTKVESRSYYYADDDGLTAVTSGVTVAQPVSDRLAVNGTFLADHIQLEPKPVDLSGLAHGNQNTGHRTPDVITSASTTVAGGAVSRKWRFEGIAGVDMRTEPRSIPSTFSLRARASHEPDYRSYAAGASWASELFERNTTLAVSLGYGYDQVLPVEAPPGQSALWPADHMRWTSGVTASQILSPVLLVNGGIAATWQRGQLANPYRRALVLTTLFPEDVPRARDRYTAFVGAAWHLGWDAALHLRQGAYADTWGVRALIPEAALVKEVATRGLASFRYHYYAQGSAAFYRAQYQAIEVEMSGDARLGRLREHGPELGFQWSFWGTPGAARWLTLGATYQLSLLRYLDLGPKDVVAHIGGLTLDGGL